MYSYRSIIKADYLQRTRSYAFLITLLVSTSFAYTFVPAADANYATVRVGNYAGENNAAWIGHVTAIMASTFLWLFGFYLINNSIQRDRATGVGQIIATTSVSNFKYLVAKSLGNFFVLLTIMCIVTCVALFLVVTRGVGYSFNGSQFFLPFLFSVVPGLFFLSCLAVFSEVVLGRYTIIQNVVFFFLLMSLLARISKGENDIYWLDVLGTSWLTSGMENIVHQKYGTNDQASVGFIFSNKTNEIRRFIFDGSNWSFLFLISRLLWIGMAIALLLIASFLFKRFDEKIHIPSRKKKNVIAEPGPLREIHPGSLPVAKNDYGIFPLIKTEMIMLLRKGPRWLWLINLGGLIASFLMPLNIAHQYALPVIWFLQVNRWADIVTKEKNYRTYYFTYTSFKPLKRLFTAQVAAAILLAITFAIPVITRYAITGNFMNAIAIISGAIFIIALSVSMGIMTGGKRLFEIVFFMLTYANISGATILDYFGAFNVGILYITIISMISIFLLAVAYIGRNYEMRHA